MKPVFSSSDFCSLMLAVYGLVPKTQYDITVKAKNFDILSSDSAPVSVTTGDTSGWPCAQSIPTYSLRSSSFFFEKKNSSWGPWSSSSCELDYQWNCDYRMGSSHRVSDEHNIWEKRDDIWRSETCADMEASQFNSTSWSWTWQRFQQMMNHLTRSLTCKKVRKRAILCWTALTITFLHK